MITAGVWNLGTRLISTTVKVEAMCIYIQKVHVGMHFHILRKQAIIYTAMGSQTTYTTQPYALYRGFSYKLQRSAFTEAILGNEMYI